MATISIKMIMKYLGTGLLLFVLSSNLLVAEEGFEPKDNLDFSQVEYVSARKSSNGTWTFSVTIRHNDQGWDHYADLWVISSPSTGEILGERVLTHPHDNEQPFTRSLSGVKLPNGQRFVEIKSKCTRHGFEGARVIIDLLSKGGENYSIE